MNNNLVKISASLSEAERLAKKAEQSAGAMVAMMPGIKDAKAATGHALDATVECYKLLRKLVARVEKLESDNHPH